MRYLPRINLEEHYGKNELEFNNIDRQLNYFDDTSSLINSFYQIKSPSFFRHRMMQLLQLFFDGITDNPSADREERRKAKKSGTELIKIGASVVGSFYRGEEMDYNSLCTQLFEYKQILLDNCISESPNARHLRKRLNLIQRVGLSVEDDKFPKNIDSLVCVANGGFEPGLLVADILEIGFVLPIRFSNWNRRSNSDYRPKCSNLFTYKNIKDYIGDKNVIVIEDLVCGGESLMETMRYVQKRNPSSLVGISASISEYYLHHYPPKEIYIKDPKTHQFTLDLNQGLSRNSYISRREINMPL